MLLASPTISHGVVECIADALADLPSRFGQKKTIVNFQPGLVLSLSWKAISVLLPFVRIDSRIDEQRHSLLGYKHRLAMVGKE